MTTKENKQIIDKRSKINITITNNYVNFKTRIPMNWLSMIGVNENDKAISLTYKNNFLYIKKAVNKVFQDLSKKEKNLQIKKYEDLYKYMYEQKKELLQSIEEYFNISYRTAYRHLQESVSRESLKSVKLIDKQEKHTRNINVMFVKINQTVVPTITIPTNLAILLLENKPHDELGIKSAYELYKENFSVPIIMEFIQDDKIIIMKK